MKHLEGSEGKKIKLNVFVEVANDDDDNANDDDDELFFLNITARKMKFSIKYFFSKCDQICGFL